MLTPTIQDVIDIARSYKQQGLSMEEAIKRAIAIATLPTMSSASPVWISCSPVR